MKTTNWQIEQSCPQCGAPATLDETDRLFACSYCRTRLRIVPAGHFHYALPPARETGGGELLYLPYWHLRGSSFSVTASGVTNRFVDTSALATDLPGLPPSLGLRPQTLKLRFLSATGEGRIIPVGRPALEALPGSDGVKMGLFLRRFIGETVSLIHAPLLLRGGRLYDAVLGRPIRACTEEEQERLCALPTGSRGEPLFAPALCPHCGWDLEGAKDSLVLVCRNCDSAWSCAGRRFEPVPFVVLAPPAGTNEAVSYLPFWRMKPRFAGLDLASRADLIRIANLPKAITPALEKEPLHFWSPAFKIRPALYARWCRQMTVFGPGGDETDRLPDSSPYPVTFPLAEAAEGIVINLAQMVRDKRRLYPKLEGLKITVEEPRLEYHPFVPRGNELLHARMGVTVDRTALSYGLGL